MPNQKIPLLYRIEMVPFHYAEYKSDSERSQWGGGG